MAVKQYRRDWTNQDLFKSITLFFLNFVILVAISAGLLLWKELNNLGTHMREYGANYLYALFCIMLLILITYLYYFFEDKSMLASGKNVALLFTLLDLSLVISWLIGSFLNIYARPVAFMALMVCVLVSRRSAIFMNIISALLIFVLDTFGGGYSVDTAYYSSLLISFSAGMLAIFFCGKAKTRFQIVAVGIAIVIPIDVIIFLLDISKFVEISSGGGISVFQQSLLNMGFGLFGGIASTVLFLTLLPLFEVSFNCLTVYRLRELTSSDARILRKLKEEAPGTYNHSVMVAQLAEASAAAIGENVDYARAAALYHDVGKLHYPEHFTENQGDYNLHDELTPELSADIIRSHAKDGYTLIKSNHLPEFLADIAIQHHGTMPIRYFYAKALKLTDGELNIDDFSYLGPKPQTKLAAIIMIADASEAAVRAINAKKPEEAERAIRGVIEERMDLEQFSECDITMVDLTRIRQALVNTLTGVYHHRIQYPNIKYRRTENGTKGESV
ncbi:MAG: HD domain-containing protein [Clostridia bacterium]|nr:HD domain-containing protein [Clostridia bacterium]